MNERTLVSFAKDTEDVAAGLHTFRDSLQGKATRITATIGELFQVSSVLREIDHAQTDPRYGPSFYRIQNDLRLVYPTLANTLDAVFSMFARSRAQPYEMVWDDLGHRMEREEGIGMLERLELYHDFLRAQFDVLTSGHQPQDLRSLRQRLAALSDRQETTFHAQRRPIDISAASTPRPGQPRPRLRRMETPRSPTSTSDEWEDHRVPGMPPPSAPEPPAPVPLSPTFTSSSSQTLNSSQTSYSSDQFTPSATPAAHWAQNVFVGNNDTTVFRQEYQLQDRSVCYGKVENSALQHLVRDGFVRALQISFDGGALWLRLYWRPLDNRARILIMTKDARGGDLHYCTPLTNLKVIREASTLQICRARPGGRYSLWARLNFYLYERMALFYCTFVAMKRQDNRDVPDEALFDHFELESREGEQTEFGGKIRDGDLCHALRVFRDRSSGAIRLEASALRGPMKDVPLWTAFLTRYAHDPDWAEWQGGGFVSLIGLRPQPYIFLAGYEPPQNRRGEYLLEFTTTDDAKHFMETWTGLCRAN